MARWPIAAYRARAARLAAVWSDRDGFRWRPRRRSRARDDDLDRRGSAEPFAPSVWRSGRPAGHADPAVAPAPASAADGRRPGGRRGGGVGGGFVEGAA